MRGRRLKGKGKGILGARETRPWRLSRALNSLSLPFQTPATQAKLNVSLNKAECSLRGRRLKRKRKGVLEKACVSANGSDVYFEAERSLPKCAWNCEK